MKGLRLRDKIRQRVAVLADECDLAVNFDYARSPRFTNKSGSKDLSSRMTNREALMWLEGFELGVNTGFEDAQKGRE
jgi:hypothetical protein